MKIKIQNDKNGTVQISKINECNQEFHMFHLAKGETIELTIDTSITINGQKNRTDQSDPSKKTYIYLDDQKIEFNKNAARCSLYEHPYIYNHCCDTQQIETILNELCFRVDSLALELSDFYYPSGKTPEAYYATCIIRYLEDQHSLQDLLEEPDDTVIFEYTPSLENDTSWYYKWTWESPLPMETCIAYLNSYMTVTPLIESQITKHCNRYHLQPNIKAYYKNWDDFCKDWCENIGYTKTEARKIYHDRKGEFQTFSSGEIIRFAL